MFAWVRPDGCSAGPPHRRMDDVRPERAGRAVPGHYGRSSLGELSRAGLRLAEPRGRRLGCVSAVDAGLHCVGQMTAEERMNGFEFANRVPHPRRNSLAKPFERFGAGGSGAATDTFEFGDVDVLIRAGQEDGEVAKPLAVLENGSLTAEPTSGSRVGRLASRRSQRRASFGIVRSVKPTFSPNESSRLIQNASSDRRSSR